jgi:prevent-host-death family protein
MDEMLWAVLTNLTNSTNWRMIQIEEIMASSQVNLYEAKTQLSSLVDRAAIGEEIVIAKSGKPRARLVALAEDSKQPRKPGLNLLGITYIADDFNAPLPEDVLQDFGL